SSDLPDTATPLPHGQRRADETAHHRPAEGVGADVGGEDVTLARPVVSLQFAYGRRALPPLAEGGEVVQAEQRLRRALHRIEIDGLRPRDGVAGTQRLGAVHRCGDTVFVVTPDRREPGVEMFGSDG